MPNRDTEDDEPMLPPDVPRSRKRRRVDVRLEQGEPRPSQRQSERDGDRYDDESEDGDPETFDHRPKGPVRHRAPPTPKCAHETSMLQSFFAFFIPPLNDTPENIRRHRMCVGLGVVGLSFLMTAAYGLLPAVGFSGFAYASAVKDIKVELLEQRLFDNRVRWCTATTAESRQFYAQKVAELLFKYRDTTGSTYQLPSCLELR
jgi:hypothetical protein